MIRVTTLFIAHITLRDATLHLLTVLNYYWSSTEVEAILTYVSHISGSSVSTGKGGSFPIRAMRAF
jgi:hypothetical protein